MSSTRSLSILATYLLLILPSLASSSEASPVCFSEEERNCLLTDREQDGREQDEETERFLPTCGSEALVADPMQRRGIIVGRLRYPGTASSHQYEQFKQYEQTNLRYSGIAMANKCSTSDLCFSADEQNENDTSLALQQIHLTGFGSHLSYDAVKSTLQHVADQQHPNQDGEHSDYYIMTTLREPGSYSHKWYAFRHTWDAVLPELADATFEEWIDLAPWRMNVLTRMLGAKSDRLAMPKSLIYTKNGVTAHDHGVEDLDVFLKDEYMIHQNELGPEESEVFATAVERLEQMVQFGLFHRLSDSWKLMEHTFCWTMGYQNYRPDKEITGFDAVKMHMDPGKILDRSEEDNVARIWTKLQEKNRLDMALMEEAERIFDERLEKMKREKGDGIVCNFLGKVEVRCADGDEESEHLRRK